MCCSPDLQVGRPAAHPADGRMALFTRLAESAHSEADNVELGFHEPSTPAGIRLPSARFRPTEMIGTPTREGDRRNVQASVDARVTDVATGAAHQPGVRTARQPCADHSANPHPPITVPAAYPRHGISNG
jgi:hypothetical protein